MSVLTQNGCHWIIHSRYYSQWVGSLPFAPHVYWNVVTDDDIIPVCTHGYKNLKSAQQQIKKSIKDIREYCLLHIQSEEEHDVERMNVMYFIRGQLKNKEQNYQ